MPKQPSDSSSGAEPGKGFLHSLKSGLKSAGQTAEKYTRIGVARAELEKQRFDLRGAHARLGEAIMKCWDQAQGSSVGADDTPVQEAVAAIRALRERIKETEAKMAALQQEKAD